MNRRTIVGLTLIILGIVFLLNNLEFLHITFPPYLFSWQMVLIALGLFQLLYGNKKGGLTLLFIGLSFLAVAYFNLHIRDYWPVILIAVGFGFFLKSQVTDQSKISRDTDDIAILASSSKQINQKTFSGGKLSSVMGSIELDLRQSSLENGQAILDTFTLMGSIKLYVPDDWVVNFEATSIMGEFADKRAHKPTEYFGDVLTIKGFVWMGSTELHS